MGDFDKVQAPESATDQKRKQILVGALGAVLLGVVGFHFLKGSPEKVHASMIPGADPIVAAASVESPAQAIAAIESDPTANLLKGTATLEAELADVPHDPFKIGD